MVSTDAEIIDRYTPKPPAQVVAGLAAADALRAQLKNGNDNPPPEAPPAGQVSPPPQAAVPQPAAAEPSPAPQVPPQPAPAPPLAEGETWEQRARSAQGRYETAAAQNRQLSERLSELETAMARLTAAGPPPPDPAVAAPPPKLITEQERTDYGDDFLQVVGKRAREEYFPEFDQLAKRLQRLEGRVEGTVQLVTADAKQTLYASLDRDIPGWRDINRSPEFKGWLGQIDPMSGRKRHDMLMEAFSRHEAGRVVSFFRGFSSAATGTPPSQLNPPATPSSSPQAPTGTTAGALTLDQLAAPGRARSAPQGDLPPEKPVYTHAWIAQFMAEKRTGKFRGREADADRIERDIYQAQHEGRIV